MKHSLINLTAMIIICGLLAGCATTDEQSTKAQGTGIGALLGAAVGAGIGYAIQGKDGAKKGALIGGGLGAVGGYMAGSKVADIKGKYASQEDELNAEIKLTQDYNDDLKKSIAETKDQTKATNDQIAQLKASNDSLEAQNEALGKQKTQIAALIKKNNGKISEMNNELAALKDYRSSVAQTENADKLQQEISALQTNIAMLDKSNRQMAKLADSLKARG